jgi:hypothetical protein
LLLDQKKRLLDPLADVLVGVEVKRRSEVGDGREAVVAGWRAVGLPAVEDSALGDLDRILLSAATPGSESSSIFRAVSSVRSPSITSSARTISYPSGKWRAISS